MIAWFKILWLRKFQQWLLSSYVTMVMSNEGRDIKNISPNKCRIFIWADYGIFYRYNYA